MEMEKETILKYVNKTVKVQLRNGFAYTLTIKEVGDTDFKAIDKFGTAVCILNSEVLVIEGGD